MSPTSFTQSELKNIRNEFPILKQTIYGHPLVYLDNAATTQKPISIIKAIEDYYTHYNSNIHRGVHYLSEKATESYENARTKIANFIGANSPKEIIFTRGTTEGINLVSNSFVKSRLHEGDEIIISHMEHHSNIVPWQLICDEKSANLKIIPITDEGELDLEQFEKLITVHTKFISVVHVSNSLGTINPVEKIIEIAHKNSIPILIDGAQAVPHLKVNVNALDCDFFAFSGHKLYGPTGIGVLYGKKQHLENMAPWQGGGDMIRTVTFEKTTYNEIPHKFEAGTPDIAGVIGLGTAVDFIKDLGLDRIRNHENDLLNYATGRLSEINGLKIIGTAKNKSAVISFVLEGIHPHDTGTILDRQGIAIRTGHHCTQPVMQRFNVPATSRASFAIYNTREEVDGLVAGISEVIRIFA